MNKGHGHFPPRQDGHLGGMNANKDLEQRLTYQQLLNLNFDLTKQNNQLKKITERLGQELRKLHTQFDIKPRQQNTQLYNAIGNHPILHKYELTLIPLLETYELNVQKNENDFQTIYEDFILLEKKFEQVTNENKNLKSQLTEKIKQNIELYKNGSSDKLKNDFGQIIMEQINEKQKILLEENSKLESQYQKYKSQSEKYKRQLIETKANYDQCKTKVKQYELKLRTNQGELKISKQNCFDVQLKNNQLHTQKNKLLQSLQRAQGQINQLIKQKDFYFKKHQDYRKKLQNDLSFTKTSSNFQEDKDKIIQNLKRDIAFLQAQKNPSTDQMKKITKLSKDNQSLTKQNSRLQQTIDQITMKKNELTQQIQNLHDKINKLQVQKTELQISQTKLKKTVQNLNNKVKSQIQYFKKTQSQKSQRLQNQLLNKIQQKQRLIQEYEDQLQKLQIQKDKLQKQNLLNSGKNNKYGSKNTKDSQKLLQKMTQKLAINKDIFDQQIQMLRAQNQNLRKQTQNYKIQTKQYKQQLRKLRQQCQIAKNNLIKVTQQKIKLTENIKKVRDQYQGDLKDKQKQFHLRIEQIKKVVQQSDRKRKLEKEKVLEISRKYQTAVEELKRMYQQNGSFVGEKVDSRVEKTTKIVY